MQMRLQRLNWETEMEGKLQTDRKLALFSDSGGLNPNPFNLNFPVRVWIRATERILSTQLLRWKDPETEHTFMI